MINSKLIRPGLIEAVFPLAEDLYMVSYIIMQKDCIIACCGLGDLLDFVKNGIEQKGGGCIEETLQEEIYGVVNDQKALEVLFHFRESHDKMWKELEKSDAKVPKARMKEYFGVEKFEREDID